NARRFGRREIGRNCAEIYVFARVHGPKRLTINNINARKEPFNMKHSKSRSQTTTLAFLFIAALTITQTTAQDKSNKQKDKSNNPPPNQHREQAQPGGDGRHRGGQDSQRVRQTNPSDG